MGILENGVPDPSDIGGAFTHGRKRTAIFQRNEIRGVCIMSQQVEKTGSIHPAGQFHGGTRIVDGTGIDGIDPGVIQVAPFLEEWSSFRVR